MSVLFDIFITLIVLAQAFCDDELPNCAYIKSSQYGDLIAYDYIWRGTLRSKVRCSIKCFQTPLCESFFYKAPSQLCQLQSSTTFTVGQLLASSDTTYYQRDVRCLYKESFPASCADIKSFKPSAGDGHYWIYPDILAGDTGVKFYCHDMANGPTEYISLKYDNFAKMHLQSNNINLDQCVPLNENPIKTATFTKIRIYLSTFAVERHDLTFATVIGADNSYSKGYAGAEDCSGESFRWPCTWHGDVEVNTKGTGFIVDPSVAWIADGWYPELKNFVRSADNTQIIFTCGGWPARCHPTSDLILQYNAVQSPVEDTGDIQLVTGYK